MTRSRPGTPAALRPRGRSRRFTFTDETRHELAALLHWPLRRDPRANHAVIDALERRAGEFLEASALSVLSRSSDDQVRDALQQLEKAVEALRHAIRDLPPKARDAVFAWSSTDTEGLHMVTRRLATLRPAILLALSDFAPNSKGGRRPDHRGQRFAADLALIFREAGGRTNLNVHGDFARLLEIAFTAVGRPTGDMGTLLRGVQRISEGKPREIF